MCLHGLKCKTCKRRPRAKHRTQCRHCSNKQHRETDLVRTAYEGIKARAKRKGREFTITLDYFRKFCYKVDYRAGLGRSADSYTVDRIIEEKGYVPGNLQKLTNSENVRKYLSYNWQTKTASVTVIKTEKDFLF